LLDICRLSNNSAAQIALAENKILFVGHIGCLGISCESPVEKDVLAARTKDFQDGFLATDAVDPGDEIDYSIRSPVSGFLAMPLRGPTREILQPARLCL
jgi:hypothetical protein